MEQRGLLHSEGSGFDIERGLFRDSNKFRWTDLRWKLLLIGFLSQRVKSLYSSSMIKGKAVFVAKEKRASQGVFCHFFEGPTITCPLSPISVG